MRAPPPVEFGSGPGRAWRAALSLLVGASVAVPVAWGLPYVAAHWGSRQPDALLDALGNPWVQAGIAGWFALLAIAALRVTNRDAATRGRTLRWDGQDWLLHGEPGRPEQRGDASLMLDLGPWVLVRFLPYAGMGSPTWLPLTVGLDMARWAALRGALWNARAGGREPRP